MFEIGDVLDGRYLLLRDLGRGAVGAVFEARHLYTGRFVALKVLASSGRPTDLPELRARMQREGQALASVRHPAIVEVLDGGVTIDGTSYLALEMLEGRTLEGLLAARTKLSVQSTVAIALQLCDALNAVHDAGIVHRDVKPANIIVQRDPEGRERIRLIDFGIAKMLQPNDDKLTGVGAVIGTPAYMSPEQLLGLDDVDAASDVYSVGITMFECLSGTMPYLGPYPRVLLEATGDQPPPSVRTVAGDVPATLVQVVDKAIAKSRKQRFSTARELAAAIEAAAPHMTRATTLLGPPPAPSAAQAREAQHRRRAKRAPYNTPVHIVRQSGAVDGRSEDISEGGMLVLTRADFAPDERVAVRFALPMEGKIVSVDAHVRWSHGAPGQKDAPMHAQGLEFVDLPPAARVSVAQYVRLMSSNPSSTESEGQRSPR